MNTEITEVQHGLQELYIGQKGLAKELNIAQKGLANSTSDGMLES